MVDNGGGVLFLFAYHFEHIMVLGFIVLLIFRPVCFLYLDLPTSPTVLSVVFFFIDNHRVTQMSKNKVDEAILLESTVSAACLSAHNAWQQLDRQVLKDAVEQCKSTSVDSQDVHFCEFLLAGHEKTFLQKAHKLFQFLGRSDMVTDITMVMKDIFFENVGDMFELRHFPNLRKSEEFGRAASSMGFRNTEVAEGMLKWSMALPTSLTKAQLVDNPKV